MAPSPTSSPGIDVEAQHLEVKSRAHEARTLQVEQGQSEDSIINDDQLRINECPGYAPQAGRGANQVERDHEAASNSAAASCVNSDLSDDDSFDPELHMIGDFDGSANALWTLYGKEAKSHDEARIETLKDDMDGVLIFAGLFSAVLTGFIIDSKQSLKVNPTDQMVYYLQQNVAMLDQISHQISSIAPQFSIPSTSPPAFPAFKPLASDVRVNACWFMALVFSLSTALLATLVQQWVRNYMQVFQQYSDPLKRGRVRQYLNEGLERWYMTAVAKTVPGLLHISLFLFFAGLCDFVLKINATVGLGSSVPIAFTSLLYIMMTLMPVIYPQSPYRTSLSGLIWYLIQKSSRGRYRYLDSDGEMMPVSPSMAVRQMQLAMEHKRDRKGRDERALGWLISNTTSDAEMDSLAMAIPGSFNSVWGSKVWTDFLNAVQDDEGTSQNEASRIQTSFRMHSTNAHGYRIKFVHAISASVARMLGRSHEFAPSGEWRMQMRTCLEVALILVCHVPVGGEIVQFGDITKPLGDIANDLDMRVLLSMGSDRSFVVSWTCLSLVAIRPILETNWVLHSDARLASQQLERRCHINEGQPTHVDKIIETLDKALGCLKALSDALIWGGDQTDERVKEILHDHESQITELEQINVKNAGFQLDDWSIGSVQQSIDRITHGIITRQLPGIKSDVSDTESVDFGQFVKLFRDPYTLLFIFPLRNLRRIRSFAQTLRNILDGRDVDIDTLQKTVMDLREFASLSNRSAKPVLRQMWRLQDLSVGGGLGFTVELFFLALKQLLSTSPLEYSHSTLYIGTFKAITSDWSKYKNSLGTQRLLLEMVTPHRGIIFSFDYPDYIVDEFLAFIGNILDGHSGPHIDDVVQHLIAFPDYLPHHALSIKALTAINPTRASPW